MSVIQAGGKPPHYSRRKLAGVSDVFDVAVQHLVHHWQEPTADGLVAASGHGPDADESLDPLEAEDFVVQHSEGGPGFLPQEAFAVVDESGCGGEGNETRCVGCTNLWCSKTEEATEECLGH